MLLIGGGFTLGVERGALDVGRTGTLAAAVTGFTVGARESVLVDSETGMDGGADAVEASHFLGVNLAGGRIGGRAVSDAGMGREAPRDFVALRLEDKEASVSGILGPFVCTRTFTSKPDGAAVVGEPTFFFDCGPFWSVFSPAFAEAAVASTGFVLMGSSGSFCRPSIFRRTSLDFSTSASVKMLVKPEATLRTDSLIICTNSRRIVSEE